MATARNAPTLLQNREAEKREIIAYYRHKIASAAPPQGLEWEPDKIGPTWQWKKKDGWLLPEATLGWEALAFPGMWMRGPTGDAWEYTAEQARFLLWYHALDEDGTHLYHSAAFQRMKGHGKDPIAATVAVSAMLAPLTFDYWHGDVPVGREEINAWIQVVAVSLDQTKNTMKLMPGLISPEARSYFGIQIGKTAVWAMGDERQIQAVTSSPSSLEGGRPTQTILNEIQNWNSSNGGHDMWGVMDGNQAKRDIGSPARMLAIFNAYRPGEDSVAERLRDAWQSTQGDVNADDAEDRPKFMDYGLMYDSLEAPAEAPLTVTAAPSVIEAIRGDSIWIDPKRILKSIIDPQNPPSESRRKWYNQITGAEDAWQTPQTWDPLARPDVKIEPGEEVALFLDCSKSDDATALVGCRISDGHVFTLGMWQRPPGKRGDGWLAPREKVDEAVTAAFERYRVVAFWGDPSHTLEDETRNRYWDGLFDEWHRTYKKKLRLWARKGRDGGHAVMFDMALYSNQKLFVEAVGIAEADIEAKDFSHDADPRLRLHVLNARRTPTKAGMSIAKEHRESKKKMDLAVCAVGARMVRRHYLNTRKKRGGRVA